MSYASEAQALHDAYMRGVKRLAESAFIEVVKPFCDRHGLWFVQKMNHFEGDKFFGRPYETLEEAAPNSNDWDEYLDYAEVREDSPECKPPKGYQRVREIIDKPLPGEDEIGLRWYMPEYKPGRKEQP